MSYLLSYYLLVSAHPTRLKTFPVACKTIKMEKGESRKKNVEGGREKECGEVFTFRAVVSVSIN